MVVAQVTGLAHAHRVVQPVGVLAVPGMLVAPKLTVARGAHVLGVVLAVSVGALGDLHSACFYLLLRFFLFSRGDLGFVFKVGAQFALRSVIFLLVEELLLHEITQKLGIQTASNVATLRLALFLEINHFGEVVEDLFFKVLS